jgi:cytochrome c oxidase subunit 3
VAGWFYSIRQESTVWGKHNDKVRKGLRLGFYLFIVSEVFFFVAIFWTFIYNGVNAHCDGIGHQWPSFGITTMSWRGVPWWESALLFCSAYTSNYAKNALKNKQNFEDTADYLLVTIVLGVLFLVAQVGEYINYKYSMADSVFGSIFYFGTGFHGSHVLIGVVFLIVMYIRLYNNDFSTKKFMGLELAIIYWHFVDAIWVGLLAVFYWWGGSIRISGNRSALVGDDGCTYLPNWDCVSFYLESLYE